MSLSNVSKHEQECFIGFKTRAASFLNDFKNIPGKACVNRVHSNYALVNVNITYKNNIAY